MRAAFRALYSRVIGAVFSGRWWLRDRRPKVFILNNAAIVYALLDGSRGRRVAPVILAEQWPKTWRFLLSCWRRDVVLAHLPQARLDARDRAMLRGIRRKLESAWEQPSPGMEEARRTFLRQRLFEGRLLEDRARRAKRYCKLMHRHRFQRVMIGDASNGECRLVVESARWFGIPADELLNGMFLTNVRNDARNGYRSEPASIDRFLAWGRRSAEWANTTALGTPCVRTGYPPTKAFRNATHAPRPGKDNWLILPSMPEGGDIRFLKSSTFSCLADVLRVLKELGFRNVRVKLHPGALSNKRYFESIAAYVGLPCETYARGSIADYLDWADYVVGPVNSGAFVEALAAGRPYYAFRLHPSSIDPRYLEGIPLMETADDLRHAIEQGLEPDGEEILQELCSIRDIPDPVDRVWAALEEGVGP